MSSPNEPAGGPVVRDLRRVDPKTGQVREPHADELTDAGGGAGRPARPGRHAASKPGGAGRPASQRDAAAEAGGDASPAAQPGGQAQAAAPAASASAPVSTQLAERVADLQRVTAEYANYRKRVERDRLAVREQALAGVLHALLPVLDDIGRAREHDELVGGFKSVGESLEAVATKLGLVRFGDEGDPFDPRLHNAIAHSYSADVAEPTCVSVLQPGYKVGERILRPATVAVAEPGRPANEGTGKRGPGPGRDEPRDYQGRADYD